MRAALSRLFCLAALALLPAACGTDDSYPSLLPLSELNAPPAIPAHAADAAADPEGVGEALRARRAETAARAAAAQRPVTDATALQARARALQDRAGVLAERDPGGAAVPAGGPGSQPRAAPDPDPETAARAEALRERARRMLDGDTPSGDLPPCPPGTADPAAANCRPR